MSLILSRRKQVLYRLIGLPISTLRARSISRSSSSLNTGWKLPSMNLSEKHLNLQPTFYGRLIDELVSYYSEILMWIIPRVNNREACIHTDRWTHTHTHTCMHICTHTHITHTHAHTRVYTIIMYVSPMCIIIMVCICLLSTTTIVWSCSSKDCTKSCSQSAYLRNTGVWICIYLHDYRFYTWMYQSLCRSVC